MYKEILDDNKYVKYSDSSNETNDEENGQYFNIFNEQLDNSIDILFKGDKEDFIKSLENIGEMLLEIQFFFSIKLDQLFLRYLVDIINFNLDNDNCFKEQILIFLRIYLRKKTILEGDYPELNSFQIILFELFEFEFGHESKGKENVNSLIIDCFCEILRIIKDNSNFVNIIRFCLNGEFHLNILTQMKLIMYLAKYQILSLFESKIINVYIFQSLEYFLNEEDDKSNIFFKYLGKIYRDYPKLVVYLQDEHIQKIIQISNQMDSCFETWFLVKNIMLAFENTNDKKLLNIAMNVDMNAFLNLVDSKNYYVIGNILDIISICINNFRELSIEIWIKITTNYYNFPTKIKSKAINCLTYLFNPIIQLPNEFIFDHILIDIISNHLQMQIFEDTINLLFILQVLIYLSIKSSQEDNLRKLFIEHELFKVVEELENDEIYNELNDKSIDNILYFIIHDES